MHVQKEVILIENAAMLQELIDTFGTYICSTVRSRFLRGPNFRGTRVGHTVNNLKTDTYVNSFIELTLNDAANESIEFDLRKKTHSVDIWYNFAARKLTVTVWYSNIKSTDTIIRSFYQDVIIEAAESRPRSNQEAQHWLINSEFEAFDSLLLVTRIVQNNAHCRVT